MRILTLVFVCLVQSLAVSAQSDLEIGYTYPDYILSALPEAKQIETELKSYEKKLQTQIEAKYKNLQAKVADYEANVDTYDELIRADKEQEIRSLQQSLQKFNQDAEASLAKKRTQLMKPAYEKISKAIEKVAKENGYTHIFNAGAPGVDILLYAREQDDVSDLILKELGVSPPAKGEGQ